MLFVRARSEVKGDVWRKEMKLFVSFPTSYLGEKGFRVLLLLLTTQGHMMWLISGVELSDSDDVSDHYRQYLVGWFVCFSK